MISEQVASRSWSPLKKKGVGSEGTLTIIADSTFDLLESSDGVQVARVSNIPIKAVTHQVATGQIQLSAQNILLYVGSFDAKTLSRDDIIYQLRGLINAVFERSPECDLYVSCLLPRVVKYSEYVTHVMCFNSALKRAVVKSRAKWPNVKYLDFYTEFMLVGEPEAKHFELKKKPKDNSDVAWKRVDSRQDPYGLRLSVIGCGYFLHLFHEFIE